MATLCAPDGVSLFYESFGDGVPIVFVHESAADTRQWRGQVAALSSTYRCIVYNARGYPPSDVPKADALYGYDIAWRDLAQVVEEVAGGPAHIVGLSMGAYAGLMLGIHRPDLVRSLFLAGCGTGSERQANQKMTHAMDALARTFVEVGSEAGATQIAASPSRTGFRHRDPTAWQIWYDDLVTHSCDGMANTFRNVQGLRPSIYAFETELDRVMCPVMLAVGDEDDGCRDVNIYLKHALPDADLWTVPNCGHAINLEAPEAFNAAVRKFVKRADTCKA